MGGHHGKRQGICPAMVLGVFRSCEIVEKAPREIASPTGVSHATDFLSRVSKKAGFIVWLKKRAGKDGQMLTIFWEDEKHWPNIKNSIIITSHK